MSYLTAPSIYNERNFYDQKRELTDKLSQLNSNPRANSVNRNSQSNLDSYLLKSPDTTLKSKPTSSEFRSLFPDNGIISDNPYKLGNQYSDPNRKNLVLAGQNSISRDMSSEKLPMDIHRDQFLDKVRKKPNEPTIYEKFEKLMKDPTYDTSQRIDHFRYLTTSSTKKDIPTEPWIFPGRSIIPPAHLTPKHNNDLFDLEDLRRNREGLSKNDDRNVLNLIREELASLKGGGSGPMTSSPQQPIIVMQPQNTGSSNETTALLAQILQQQQTMFQQALNSQVQMMSQFQSQLANMSNLNNSVLPREASPVLQKSYAPESNFQKARQRLAIEKIPDLAIRGPGMSRTETIMNQPTTRQTLDTPTRVEPARNTKTNPTITIQNSEPPSKQVSMNNDKKESGNWRDLVNKNKPDESMRKDTENDDGTPRGRQPEKEKSIVSKQESMRKPDAKNDSKFKLEVKPEVKVEPKVERKAEPNKTILKPDPKKDPPKEEKPEVKRTDTKKATTKAAAPVQVSKMSDIWRKMKPKNRLKIFLWVMMSPILLIKDVDDRIHERREIVWQGIDDLINEIMDEVIDFYVDNCEKPLLDIYNEPNSLPILAPKGKKISDKELQKNGKKILDRLIALFNVLNDLTKKKQYSNDVLRFLASIVGDQCVPPQNYFTPFELYRLQFTMYATLKDMEPFTIKMIFTMFIIVRVLIQHIICVPWELFDGVSKTSLLTGNLKSFASVLYHAIMDYFRKNLKKDLNNQEHIFDEIKVKTLPDGPLVAFPDEVDPKMDRKNADEVLIGVYSKEQLEPFFKANKKQYEELQNLITKWHESFFNLLFEFNEKERLEEGKK